VAASPVPIAALDTVLIKVASRCNINCSYCYVYNMGDDNWARQSKLMLPETVAAICEALAALIQHQTTPFSVVLHGGEPLLLGFRRLDELLGQLRAVLPATYPISLQTNGILLSEQLLDCCAAHHVSVAVSLDGPAAVHDRFRLTHAGGGTFAQVMAGIACLKVHPATDFLNAGLLAVIDPSSDPAQVYRFFKSVGAPSVDFLYRDGNHSKLPEGKAHAQSLEYGQWMESLLTTYAADPDPLPIRVLDDMLKVLLGGASSKEGLGVTDFSILIIDTDGTFMKNDTLKSSYNGADQFMEPVNVREANLLDFLASPEYASYRALQQPTHAKCLTCPALNVCGGGMILHRYHPDNGFDNPSIYCADQLHLVSAMRRLLGAYHPDYAPQQLA
jgi:uncharacterized protein